MQTELKTAKDDKLVDLDTSGEGAEVELEDKSHGTVKPDKYEDVKTEEVEPLAPKVEVAEETANYARVIDGLKPGVTVVAIFDNELENNQQVIIK